MRKMFFLLLILLLGNLWALDIYKYDSMQLSLEYSKNLVFFDDTGDYLEAKFLSYSDFPDSKIIELKEFAKDSKGNLFYPKQIQDKYGNNYAVYKINKVDKNITFYTSFLIKTYANINLEDKPYIRKSNEYTKRTKYINPDSKDIDKLANQIKDKFFYKTIFNLDNWLRENIEYEIRPDFVNGNVFDSDQMLALRKGFCVEHSNLAAAVLRHLGIPTRIVVGIVNTSKDWGMHAWLEVQNPDGEWIGYDPTYHEIGYLNASHIKQGVFLDYSEVKDTIKADFSLENYQLNVSYNPLDLDVKVVDKHLFTENIKTSFESNINADSNFAFCFFSDNLKIFPLYIKLHDDFLPNSFRGLIYLKGKKCFFFKAPNTKDDLKYSYFVSFLDRDIEDFIKVKGNFPMFKINTITPHFEDDKLFIDYNVFVDRNLRVSVIANFNNRKIIDEFDLNKGNNYFVFETSIDGNFVNVKLVYDGKTLQESNIKLNSASNAKTDDFVYGYIFIAIFFVIFIVILIFLLYRT